MSNLGGIFAAHLDANGTALIDRSRPGEPAKLSYRDLDRRCGALAAGLLAAGLEAGDRFGILSHNRGEFLELVFAALRVGIVPVPINIKLARETVALIAEDAGLALMFCDADHAHLCPEGVRKVDLDTELERYRGHAALPVAELSDESESLLLYTSGSTGRPKGVVQSHVSQLWTLNALAPPPQSIPPNQRMLVAAPLYHKNGMFSSKLALRLGAGIVLLPRFTAVDYIAAIAEHHCTSIGGVPTMYALVVREKELLARSDLSCVQRISIGSAPLTGALLEEVQGVFPNATITNGYGTTESGPAVFGMHPELVPTPPLSLGYPLPDVETRLVAGASEDEGELWIRSPGLMHGYLNLENATQRALEEGSYKTGDLMRRDSDGFYFFVGRVDDMFNCGGENVYPGEVESLLERHSGIQQAAIVPVDDHIKGQIPVAFVVRSAGASVDESSVKKFALENGPAYQHPRHVLFIDDMPLAGSKKIDKATLRRRAANLAR